MKTIKFNLTFLVIMLCTITTFAQTIRRVNNTGISLGENMYETLQAAHNAADDGDIIYVDGSGTAYGNLDCTKKLIIIGPGYFLGENYTYFPDLRYADLGTVTFEPGSEGSSLRGCSSFSVYINASNITISGNSEIQVHSYAKEAITEILINKNYGVRLSEGASKAISLAVYNNYVTYLYLNGDNNSGQFANNIFAGGSFSIENFTVSNNIMISSGGSPSLVNCALHNNIDARALSNSTAFGTENGNLGNVDKNTLFLGPTGNSTDGQWQLKEGSVAIGAGFEGTDCGIYGGSNPYELSGISSSDYPAIIKMITSGTGSDAKPLSVTISTK